MSEILGTSKPKKESPRFVEIKNEDDILYGLTAEGKLYLIEGRLYYELIDGDDEEEEEE